MDEVRAQIIAEALAWEGTPWKHRQCLKGVGVDCVRFAEGVAKAVGLLSASWQPPIYSPEWHLHQNVEMLQQALQDAGAEMVPLDQAQPGDMALFQFGRVCSHAGILLPDNLLIHAVRTSNKVVRHGLRGDLAHRLRAVYRFPGVA